MSTHELKVGDIAIWHNDAPDNPDSRLWKVTKLPASGMFQGSACIEAVHWNAETEEHRPSWWCNPADLWVVLDAGVLEL